MRATWAGCHDDRRPRIDPPAEDDPRLAGAVVAPAMGFCVLVMPEA
jgi:hypothetical protein